MKTFSRNNSTVKFLTKGDNNSVDDRGLYAPGQLWLTKSDVVGRARGFLPYVGMVTILMNEYPKFKVNRAVYHISSSGNNIVVFFAVCGVSLLGFLRTSPPGVNISN